MKKLIKIFSVTLIIFICFCKKDSSNTSLTGKWKETEYYLSIGGPGSWMPFSSNTNYYVQFNSNGSIEGNAFSGYISYTIKDSKTITLYKQDNTIENYSYSIANGILQMSPIGPIVCTEGCGSRFTKG